VTGVSGVSGRAAAPGDPRAARDQRLLGVVRALREGEVTTYGDVAEVAGHPGRSRLVGRLLSGIGDQPDDRDDDREDDQEDDQEDEVPWWRVVAANGRLVPGHEREQSALLRAEGVEVADGRVRSAPLGRFHRR
jgi:methylated-DNA-protein-cysteine methyltransferase-like protein